MYSANKDQVFLYLSTFLTKKTRIVVGVSWWPDSMFLATCLQEYYKQKRRDQGYIAVAHYNHGQRKESTAELGFLKKHFAYNTFYRNIETPNKWLSETKLREHRHIFFEEVLHESKSQYLFLWHNLTDRIETSLMNMVRGASKDGILWIKPTQKKNNYTIYRPLLDISKKDITQACEEYHISYFVDATNQKLITPRNIIRNNIVPQIEKLHAWWEKNRTNSWVSLYTYLSWNSEQKWKRNKHTPHKFRGAKHWFSSTIEDVDDSMLMQLFKNSYYATSKTLTIIKKFIRSSQWHLYVWSWYIFKAWNTIHCIDGKKDFWKEKQPYQKTISQHWNVDINWYTYTIPKQRIWYTFRYPQPWDIYKNKRLLKVLLNLKVPVFMRNVTGIIINKDSIISILQANDSTSNIS